MQAELQWMLHEYRHPARLASYCVVAAPAEKWLQC